MSATFISFFLIKYLLQHFSEFQVVTAFCSYLWINVVYGICREIVAFNSPVLSCLKGKSSFKILNLPALIKVKGIERFSFLLQTELKPNIFCLPPGTK